MPFDYDLQAKVALSDAFLVHYRAAAIEPISAVRLQLANARRWPGAAAGVPSQVGYIDLVESRKSMVPAVRTTRTCVLSGMNPGVDITVCCRRCVGSRSNLVTLSRKTVAPVANTLAPYGGRRRRLPLPGFPVVPSAAVSGRPVFMTLRRHADIVISHPTTIENKAKVRFPALVKAVSRLSSLNAHPSQNTFRPNSSKQRKRFLKPTPNPPRQRLYGYAP